MISLISLDIPSWCYPNIDRQERHPDGDSSSMSFCNHWKTRRGLTREMSLRFQCGKRFIFLPWKEVGFPFPSFPSLYWHVKGYRYSHWCEMTLLSVSQISPSFLWASFHLFFNFSRNTIQRINMFPFRLFTYFIRLWNFMEIRETSFLLSWCCPDSHSHQRSKCH